MSQRFFVDSPINSAQVKLAGDEARHLSRVMRARKGTSVTLFDGTGVEFLARVARIDRHTVELEVLARQSVDRELRIKITLAVALPKGDRQKWLVEKAVELGVASLIPLETDRGVAQPTDNALDRLRRHVIEASKQCGRNRLMTINPPQTVAELLSDDSRWGLRLLAQPGGKPLQLDQPLPESLAVMIGPEGGFTDDELSIAGAAGWSLTSLGSRTLRVETAALSLVVQVAAADESA